MVATKSSSHGGRTRARPDASATLGGLLLALYAGVREPDGWLEFQRLLSRQLGTISSVLSLRWPDGARPGLLYVYNGDAARLPPQLQPYAAIDPFVNIVEGRAVRLLDLVDPAEFRKTTYYREWLVPIGVEYALGLDVREADRFHARLRLCRAKADGEFSSADCRLVESLAPHLRLAVALYSELDEAKSGRELYADAMDSLTLATVVSTSTAGRSMQIGSRKTCWDNATDSRSRATVSCLPVARIRAASASSSARQSSSSTRRGPPWRRPCA
jgi:hypothetical protein